MTPFRCVDEDAIDEEDLEAYSRGVDVGGRIASAIEEHLLVCPYCLLVVEEYHLIEVEKANKPAAKIKRAIGKVLGRK
jgi:hypothetical protein